MTFLDPASGITAAALGGAGLVIFYLLRLRRRPVRVSTTLFWPASAADLQVNVPIRWLRPSWLLLLQLMALGCLAAALGRPALDGSGDLDAPTILVIDRSASMSAIDEAGSTRTRLENAQRRAVEILEALPSETRAMVVGFAAEASGLTNFTRDRALLRRAVEGILPSDQPGRLAGALELVRALVGRSDEGEAREEPRVVLIGDGGYEAGAAAKGVGRARFEYARIGGAHAADNVGISGLAARRDYEDPAEVRLFARVQSNVPRALSVPIECRVGEVVVASATVSLSPGSPGSPSSVGTTLEFLNTEGGLVSVSIGRSDDLASDNVAGLMLRRPASVRMALVRPNVAADSVDAVVRAALEALEPGSLRVMTAGEYERDPALVIGSSDLIVFDRVRPATLPRTPTMSFGATLPIPGLGVLDDPDGPATRSTGVLFWVRSHPVMRYVTMSEVWVNSPLRLTLPDPNGASSGAGLDVEALATGADGPLITLIEQGGVRRLVVGFDIGESNWIRDAGFHIFLKNAMDYLTLTGEDEAGRIVRTGETAAVRTRPGAKRLEAKGPAVYSREVEPGGGEWVPLGPFERVGVYALDGASEENRLLAVNLLEPLESALESRESVEVAGGSVTAARAGSIAPREVWPWFVLAAVVLLAVEWLVFALRMRV